MTENQILDAAGAEAVLPDVPAKSVKKPGTKAAWINAVLIPVKQHWGCCVLLPLAANAIGGGAAAWLATDQAEWMLFAVVPPLVTYGVMKAEQKIHDIRHRKEKNCTHDHTTLTRKNYLRQTALAYVFYAASHFLTHDVLHWDHHSHTDQSQTNQGEKNVLSIHHRDLERAQSDDRNGTRSTIGIRFA